MFSLLFTVGLLHVLTVPCTAAPQATKVFTTLPYHFTLAAYSIKPPHANGTGVPLVLAPDGAVTGEEFQVSAVCTLAPPPISPAEFVLQPDVGFDRIQRLSIISFGGFSTSCFLCQRGMAH